MSPECVICGRQATHITTALASWARRYFCESHATTFQFKGGSVTRLDER